VRSDNEPVFRTRLLRFAMKLLRIHQQFTQPHSPWQNGRIERLFGTLKPLLRKVALANVGMLDKALFEFQLFYNYVRPHQNPGGRTPAEVWRAGSASAPLGCADSGQDTGGLTSCRSVPRRLTILGLVH
jgi:putative transposase